MFTGTRKGKVYSRTGREGREGSRVIAAQFLYPWRSMVVGGQRQAPVALSPRNRPCTNCTGGWVGRRVGRVKALRLCTGRTAHRGSRGIALLFHDQRHSKWVRGQRHAPAALYHRERPGTHCTGTEALYRPYGP